MLIMFVAILMILGGTLCGIEEEAVAFYPVALWAVHSQQSTHSQSSLLLMQQEQLLLMVFIGE
ncbi:Uncharacterised protein [Mycobacteroides abscessus subsp. abscessus]|nr:Uncharacterised protein [Mycobacteroides abscessus subsp. abscessus]